MFVCITCGTESPTSLPKCRRCNTWNAFVDPERTHRDDNNSRPRKLTEIPTEKIEHIPTGFLPLDYALASKPGKPGGWVPGGIYLLAGAPGAGKSTLVLQVVGEFQKIYCVTGEEREEAIKLRANRIGLKSARVTVWRQNNINRALGEIEFEPDLLLIDSAHSEYSPDVGGSPGSNQQLVEVCRQVMEYTHDVGCVTIIIAQINKKADVAGPKLVEHMVDTVMEFDYATDEDSPERILRIGKNRWGATPQKVEFRMTESGLVPLLAAVG